MRPFVVIVTLNLLGQDQCLGAKTRDHSWNPVYTDTQSWFFLLEQSCPADKIDFLKKNMHIREVLKKSKISSETRLFLKKFMESLHSGEQFYPTNE